MTLPRIAALTVLVASLPAGRAAAETLGDAIAMAYQTNPLLLADRADLRALDERYVQARAAFGPQASVNFQENYNNSTLTTPKTAATSTTPAAPMHTTHYGWIDGNGFRVTIAQPLYDGGQLETALSTALAEVLAGRESLREQEANVLNEVIGAYADVLLYRALLLIANQDVDILRAQMTEIEAKFAVKEVTITDRAQTQARLIASRIGVERARSSLRGAEARYVAAVGQAPGALAPLPDLPGVPVTIDAALNAADAFNPALLAARYTEVVTRSRIAEARASDGFQVSLSASYGREPYTNYLKDQRLDAYEASVTVNKPLFTSGSHASRVRQAVENDNRDALKAVDARRQAIRTVSRAWNDLVARRQLLVDQRSQLKEEEKAFKGYKIEDKLGLRSTIDVLNAEQEYQSTKVSLFQGYHDEYLTRSALLSATTLGEPNRARAKAILCVWPADRPRPPQFSTVS